jgi:NAD-dependent dihydropyrimidine dehydrogenase PreA subunit
MKGMYVIAEPCVGVKDKACVAACPVDCIHEGEKQLYIDPAICIGCGACEPVCPPKAIFVDFELPEKWKGAIRENAEFFERHEACKCHPA